VAVLTLAVGIGSTAAIFAVVNGVLLKPLPFKDPDRLVGIWHTAPGLGFKQINQSPALQFTYAAENHSFTAIGMWDNASVSVTGRQKPEQVPAMIVTHETLPLLGVEPSLGRSFTSEDDAFGSPETAMLSYGYWQSHFGGDPHVLQRTITVDGKSRQIIGVLPKGLEFLRYNPEIYLPFQFDPTKLFVGNFSYQGVARLKPGVTLAEADADVNRMIPMAVQRYPGGISLAMLQKARFAASLHPLKQDVVGNTGNVLWVLLGTVAIILLIACANVANLFLVRAEGRQQEVAIRTAMGAARGRIVRDLLGESVVLGLLGGLVGLVLAWGGLKLLLAIGPASLPRLHDIGIDGRVLGFTFLISALAGVLFGIFPALRYAGPNLVTALKESGRGGDAGRERHFARNTLVVAQMALALVLLTGSGLMIRSFMALRHVNPGFRGPDHVLTFRVAVPADDASESNQVQLTFQQILDRIRAVPGVTSAAMTTSVTMDGHDNNDAVQVEGHTYAPGQIPPIRRYKFVGNGYIETMRNTVVAGRTLTRADIEDRAHDVMVTQDLARAEWGSAEAALGKRIRSWGTNKIPPSPWYTVVGVVGDVHDNGVGEDAVPTIYWPEVVEHFWGDSTYTSSSRVFVVRSASANPAALLPAMRKAVWAVNPNLPLARVRTLSEIVSASVAQTSFTLIMLGIAALVALFLGAVGIYGVISYVVAQRTREIGVRMALGAERYDVTRMVLGDAFVLAGIGVAIGLGAAAGLTRLMASLLFGVSALDPLTFAVVALVLTAIALLASYVPARRAAGVDPVEALTGR
jgi:predicted permease